jgi:acyl-CoA dehydrogenase
MLPREFTEEQQMFRQAYRKFLSAEIVPHMESWRAQGIVDRSAFRKAGERGFLMVWPEERFGGSGDADFLAELERMKTKINRNTVLHGAPAA